ncbi:hypothetical protein M569_14009 [Genlisea aurea]|uniref:Filament-like plant protein n=1 Tax=Genlisea aurea TaxID=192259 RepID=S8DMG1_9LAMI|nr:hypothetical protein M569_14009 [Genlisea aurea]
MSWPWKKKSSSVAATDAASSSLGPSASPIEKEGKKPKYVQISMESYAYLNGLEDQVRSYEEQVQSMEDDIRELNGKLSEANAEITSKEDLVKQHTKVAEEAVSGWEKAEAEATALKSHLESVTLLKLTAEDRGAHLDIALKECMKQIRHLKEENEQKLQDLAASKVKVFDRMKAELEGKLINSDKELLGAAAEIAALSRTLHERSAMLVNLSEEKSQADVQIQLLKSNIESCEKEVNSLKYELHIAKKETEIRNEERNMSVRSADAANRQHLDGLKKIAKLEAECQRLRSLVRKKLPGPAALAQMKLEVESLGRDNGESRFKRSPAGKPASPHSPQALEISSLRENDLAERLISMEEETKMLKEVLSTRNSELQASRNLYAQTASKLQSLESELSILKFSDGGGGGGGFFPSGSDDNGSNAGSWSNQKSEKNPRNSICLDLMEDFLEMEKLADVETSAFEKATIQPHVFWKLKSLVSMAMESMASQDDDRGKIVENVRNLIQDMNDCLLQQQPSEEDSSSPELKLAAAGICDFIAMLGREAKLFPDATLEQVSAKYSGTAVDDDDVGISLASFVLDVSRLFSEAGKKLQSGFLGIKGPDSENGSSDCIDKVALAESKPFPIACGHFSDVSSECDLPNVGVPTSDSSASSSAAAAAAAPPPWKCSPEEFDQLKRDRDGLAADLSDAKSQLQEAERLLAELKSQLSSAHKSNGLADVQLKCMAESYRSLETRTEELVVEANRLRGRVESLESELHDERTSHQEALYRCKDLQDRLERIEVSEAAFGIVEKTCQEKELASAAEKLAECQESILLLGKQLMSLQPQTETTIGSVVYGRSRNPPEQLDSEEPTVSGTTAADHPQDVVVVAEATTTTTTTTTPLQLQRTGRESPPSDAFSYESELNSFLTSPSSSKPARHRASFSGSTTPTRGFSRFFSSTKGK